MSVEDRFVFVRQRKLCINCLVPGHFVRDCSKKSFCRVHGCTDKHSTFLHPKEPRTDPPSDKLTPGRKDEDNSRRSEEDHAAKESNNGYVRTGKSPLRASASMSTAGLAVVPVKVKAKGKAKTVETYAFLDSGSNTSFCTEKLMRLLNLEGTKMTLSLTTMESANTPIETSYVNLEVLDLNEDNVVELPMVFSRPSLPISRDSIAGQKDVNRWPHLKGITIPHIEAEVGLLIGSDAPKALQPIEVRESKNGGPFATRTVLGWVLNDPLGRRTNQTRTANFIKADVELNQQFERFCDLEFNDSIYDPKTSMSQNDKRALDVMKSTARLTNGHYEIALPWKNYPPCLKNNKSLAENRLKPLKRRLERDPSILVKYKENHGGFVTQRLRQTSAQSRPWSPRRPLVSTTSPCLQSTKAWQDQSGVRLVRKVSWNLAERPAAAGAGSNQLTRWRSNQIPRGSSSLHVRRRSNVPPSASPTQRLRCVEVSVVARWQA